MYVLWGVGLAVVIALFTLGDRFDSALIGPAIALVSLAVVIPSFLLPRRMLDTVLAEARVGYTTTGGTMMISLRNPLDPYWVTNRRRVEFDLAGLWHVGADGEVKAEPDRRLDPPGFYPSPHEQDQYELWTGRYWTGHYRATAPDVVGSGSEPGPEPGSEPGSNPAVQHAARLVFAAVGLLLLVPSMLVFQGRVRDAFADGVDQTPSMMVIGASGFIMIIGLLLLAFAWRSR